MKKRAIKYLSLTFTLICIFTLFAPKDVSAAFDPQIEGLRCEALLVMSLDDGTVVIDKNSSERRAPSGLSGVATVITAIENCDNLEALVTVKGNITSQVYGTNTSTMSLKDGEEIRLIDLLYGIMLNGATDAAVTLADYISGDIVDFVRMMNETAAKAGCQNTNFTNAHGLDDDEQYSTAHDLALIAAYALKNSQFDKIAKSFSYTIPATNKSAARTIYTTNLMMNVGYKSYYNSLAQGLRTGTTTKAGRCVITTASKDGYSYVAVAMGGPQNDSNGSKTNTNYAFVDCNEILKWTFQNIKLRVIAAPHQQVAEIKLNLASEVDYLRLVPEREVTALVPSGVDSESVLIKVIEAETPKEIDAPVQKGTVLGKASILYANSEIAQVNLVAADGYERSTVKYIERLIKDFIFSKVFIILLIIFAVCVVFYIFVIKAKKPKKIRRIK